MSRLTGSASPDASSSSPPPSVAHALQPILARGLLPFGPGDTTGGTETELQAAVIGDRAAVDLPRLIEGSDFLANVQRRAAAGDLPRENVHRLQRYLEHAPDGVWENSWVRFPHASLGRAARAVLSGDLKAVRGESQGPDRGDSSRFLVDERGEPTVRVPVSDLVRLALADASDDVSLPQPLHDETRRVLDAFLSDNTSPETISFHVVDVTRSHGNGRVLARETSRRFLLAQLAVAWANARFRLVESGQRVVLFHSPLPPMRQRELNGCISDAFYRELFMSPCLSGWERGEEKQRYMEVCHEVLTRSKLHAVAKLREAGIIRNNLVVMPDVSSTSLANNGTHVSLGSRCLGELQDDPSSGFDAACEKRLGDMVIKVVEHFLPLFVGTYSAAPWRVGFHDFHPETMLGFLPHQLEDTHLRMLWRRWKVKARIRLLGRPTTPFGPSGLDRSLAALFGLRGDFVPDFRLIDFPVALLSSRRSPALDGTLGNEGRLKRDLQSLGVFDTRMSLYLPFRMRARHAAGYSGFEGRQHSLFPSLHDMARAVDLQVLLCAYAYRLVLEGRIVPSDIPDTPLCESERRQVLFAAATGVPTFYVAANTRNRLLRGILERTSSTRSSHRYPGYVRVKLEAYRRALVDTLTEEAGGLARDLGLGDVLPDLLARLDPNLRYGAGERLVRDALDETGARSPLDLRADDFNRAIERHYRTRLRATHVTEGLDVLAEDFETVLADGSSDARELARCVLRGRDPAQLVARARQDLVHEQLDPEDVGILVRLALLVEHGLAERATRMRTSPSAGHSAHAIPSLDDALATTAGSIP